jgi:4,5:9,10-diseco-3-hydroxy-5,9,17-trioxoandrosta-1(10),2-diene-4-oate hydrolase
MLSTPQLKTNTSPNIAANAIHAGVGAPVVMLHGLAASLHDWDDLLPALVQSGYSGHALDLLGHGDSMKPSNPEEYNADTVFGHMKGWLDSLKLDKAMVLIGHSLGGFFSLRYAQQYPQNVRALVLVNPFYSQEQLPAPLRLVFKQPLLNTTIIERTPYWLFRVLIDLSSLQFGKGHGNTHTLPEGVRQQTALDYKRSSPGIYNIPRTLPIAAPDLSDVTHPTLVLWGARDQTLDPDSFGRLVKHLPNAQGEALPVCGHVPHQCHATMFNEKVLRFLDTIEVKNLSERNPS